MEKFILFVLTLYLVVLGLVPVKTLLQASEATPTATTVVETFRPLEITYIVHDTMTTIKVVDYKSDVNKMFYNAFPKANFIKLVSKEGYYGYIVSYGNQKYAVMKKRNSTWLITYQFQALSEETVSTGRVENIIVGSVYKWGLPLNH